ncbi:MAG TPA: metal-sulfur cluster assembly factor [Ferrovibrio sp.]|uniref:metal-sulfur cluster assembly factor n=1 Tax=Ferrovibrio sp. TaxID=1917215 RepID=UPI002ED2BA6F
MTQSQISAEALDPDILDCLQSVLDPEVGLSVVDLGLVYRARRISDHAEVALTLTTRACPLGAMIKRDAEQRLLDRFPELAGVDVELVWDPPWTPDRITERGRALLGHRRGVGR